MKKAVLKAIEYSPVWVGLLLACSVDWRMINSYLAFYLIIGYFASYIVVGRYLIIRKI